MIAIVGSNPCRSCTLPLHHVMHILTVVIITLPVVLILDLDIVLQACGGRSLPRCTFPSMVLINVVLVFFLAVALFSYALRNRASPLLRLAQLYYSCASHPAWLCHATLRSRLSRSSTSWSTSCLSWWSSSSLPVSFLEVLHVDMTMLSLIDVILLSCPTVLQSAFSVSRVGGVLLILVSSA